MTMTRRDFLKRSGLLGLGVAGLPLVAESSEAVSFDRNRTKVSKTRLTMGTYVSMTLIHASKHRGEEAMGRAFEEIARLTHLLSRFESSAAVALLNAEGELRDLPPELHRVVSESLAYHRLTGGRFDITIKPVVDLFRERFGEGEGRAPTDAEIDGVMGLVDAGGIALQEKTLRFRKPGMGITLDGIAKGYIVDRAAMVIRGMGVEDFLINAGGDILTQGSREDRGPWTIAIQDPEKRRDTYPDRIQLTGGAIATSGNYEAFFDREKVFHHIVNPSTGRSPRENVSVSILAPTTMQADALATAVCIMGPEEGTQFVERLPGCASFIIARDGQCLRSRGWKSAPA